MNQNFIKLNDEIIQLKLELHKRSINYAKNKNRNVPTEEVETSVINVLSKVSKRTIEALG